MRVRVVLVCASIYMAVLGLGFIFAPQIIGIDAVPVDASPALLAFLRIPGSAFIAISVMDFIARAVDHSPARNAIVVANEIGFGLAAILNVVGVLTGGRPLALLFCAIHLAFTISFLVAGRRGSHESQRN
ncbi:MAG TPA: hypothetical protein VMG34_02295 [Bacteroidota bacterium]|nr:hypothetical protein [Bacteroidota bacterium]